MPTGLLPLYFRISSCLNHFPSYLLNYNFFSGMATCLGVHGFIQKRKIQ